MKKVLYVSANPNSAEVSHSKKVAETFVQTLQQADEHIEVETLDLYATDVQEIDGDVLSAWGKFGAGEELTETEAKKVATMGAMLEKFMAADVYVFATPMWNFFFPARMKMFIDSVVMAGQTFRYTENGPVGLLENKRAVHIQAMGGVYSGTGLNFGDDYLRQVLGFIGVSDMTTIAVEGVSQFPDRVEEIVAEANEKATTLAHEIASSILV